MWPVDHQYSRLKQYTEHFPAFQQYKYLGEGGGHAFCFHSNEEANLNYYVSMLASLLLCEKLQEDKPCQVCEGCRSYRQKDPSRYLVIFPEGQRISISAVRSIQSHTSLKLEAGKKQVILIHNPARLGLEAANALLKTLEEPGEGRIFLLVNPYSKNLLPTISSRVNHVVLPSAKALFSDLEADVQLMARLSDYHLYEAHDTLTEFVKNDLGLHHFYKNWLLEFKEAEFSFEKLLQMQSGTAHWGAGRKLAVAGFLDEISMEGAGYLELEIEKLKRIMDDFSDYVILSGKAYDREMRQSVGLSYSHWLVKDMGEDELKRFYRGFLYREIEALLRDVFILFETILLSHEVTGILPREQQIGRNYAHFDSPGVMLEFSAFLSDQVRMLYNNVNWATILEQLGFYLIQRRSEELR